MTSPEFRQKLVYTPELARQRLEHKFGPGVTRGKVEKAYEIALNRQPLFDYYEDEGPAEATDIEFHIDEAENDLDDADLAGL